MVAETFRQHPLGERAALWKPGSRMRLRVMSAMHNVLQTVASARAGRAPIEEPRVRPVASSETSQHPRLPIYVTSGKGHKSTPLSAFDAALKDAGVYNYNLIILSSIIPPNSDVRVERYPQKPDEYGHKLYVVKSEIRSPESGTYIGAALGWYQLPDGSGVFVEHEARGSAKHAVEENLAEDVRRSLRDLCQEREFSIDDSRFKMEQSVAQVTDSPASALVLAVYKSEGWR